MKPLILVVLLALSGAANAQKTSEPNWLLLKSSKATDYSIDTSSLTRNGEMVLLWESIIFKEKPGSAKILREYDCKTKQQRTLSATFFSKNDFSGKTTEMPKEDWKYIIRGSFGEEIMEFACKEAPKQGWMNKLFNK